jgi:hypothetical protein
VGAWLPEVNKRSEALFNKYPDPVRRPYTQADKSWSNKSPTSPREVTHAQLPDKGGGAFLRL